MNKIKLLSAFCGPVMMVMAGCSAPVGPTDVFLPSPNELRAVKFSTSETIKIQTIKITPAEKQPCSAANSDNDAKDDGGVCKIDINVTLIKNDKGKYVDCSVTVNPNVDAGNSHDIIRWVIKPIDEPGKRIEFISDGPPIRFTSNSGFIGPANRITARKYLAIPVQPNAGVYDAIYMQWINDDNKPQLCIVDPIINND